MLNTKFIEKTIAYTGKQLQGKWIQNTFGIKGDALVSFIGRCDVYKEYMVDMEDLRQGKSIYSEKMLHFIAEYFEVNLEKIVLRQRLLTVIIAETLNNILPDKPLTRSGDDLFDRDAKLTISIATTSTISSLIHLGINISSYNTPVKTKGLNDYAVEPVGFAGTIMKKYIKEEEEINFATKKVKLVDVFNHELP